MQLNVTQMCLKCPLVVSTGCTQTSQPVKMDFKEKQICQKLICTPVTMASQDALYDKYMTEG